MLSIPSWLWRVGLVVWTAVLIALSVWRGPEHVESQTFSFFWNASHAGAYGLLFPLAIYSFSKQPNSFHITIQKAIPVLLFVIAIGSLTEWLQSFTPTRRASVYDVLTNLAGALSFFALLYWYERGQFKGVRIWVWLLGSALLCSLPVYFDTFS